MPAWEAVWVGSQYPAVRSGMEQEEEDQQLLVLLGGEGRETGGVHQLFATIRKLREHWAQLDHIDKTWNHLANEQQQTDLMSKNYLDNLISKKAEDTIEEFRQFCNNHDNKKDDEKNILNLLVSLDMIPPRLTREWADTPGRALLHCSFLLYGITNLLNIIMLVLQISAADNIPTKNIGIHDILTSIQKLVTLGNLIDSQLDKSKENVKLFRQFANKVGSDRSELGNSIKKTISTYLDKFDIATEKLVAKHQLNKSRLQSEEWCISNERNQEKASNNEAYSNLSMNCFPSQSMQKYFMISLIFVIILFFLLIVIYNSF